MGHTCRGTINLATANITVEDSCNFVISNGGAQTYHLKASSEVERQRWITALELAKAKAVRMQAESGERAETFMGDIMWKYSTAYEAASMSGTVCEFSVCKIRHYLPRPLSQTTPVMIVPQLHPAQDRVEAAVTQKSSPHCEQWAARWRTSPPATISLSSMGLPFKGICYLGSLTWRDYSTERGVTVI